MSNSKKIHNININKLRDINIVNKLGNIDNEVVINKIKDMKEDDKKAIIPSDKVVVLENKYGENVYNTNKTFKHLANVMEHPEFRSFIDKYFKTPSDTDAMLMFIKVYQYIDKSHPMLTPYQKIGLLHAAMNNKKYRENICNSYLKWSNIEQKQEVTYEKDI